MLAKFRHKLSEIQYTTYVCKIPKMLTASCLAVQVAKCRKTLGNAYCKMCLTYG